MAALVVAISAVGMAGFANFLWRDLARYAEAFSPVEISGGAAFSLNFYPWAIYLVACLITVFGMVLLAVSYGISRAKKLPTASGLHVFTGLLLVASVVFLGGLGVPYPNRPTNPHDDRDATIRLDRLDEAPNSPWSRVGR